MRTLKKKILLCCVLAGLLGGCIPDSLDDCPPEPDKEGNNVDITVDMDTSVDMGEQETEMP